MNAVAKTCTKCQVEKPRDCFSVDRTMRTGLKSWCKGCCKAQIDKDRDAHRARVRKNYADNPDAAAKRRRKWREENRERCNEQAREYRERNPEAVLKAQRKYRETHRETCSARSNSWRDRNREAVRLIHKNKGHRRRARMAGGMTTPELRLWQDAQRKVCHWCGVKCGDGFHIDHRLPLARGGKHETRNLVIACAPCNLKKRARCPIEFAQSLGRLL